MRIDTHQHFWDFSPENYSWIDPDMGSLRRDFTPADLKPLLEENDVCGTVLVEARGALSETERLLEVADRTSFVLGVVGWVPLTDPNVSELLARFSANPKFRGVRHAIGAEPDADYLFRSDFNGGIAALKSLNLVYDLCFWPPLLERAIQFVDRHPDQVMVLDHCAKPYIREGKVEPWSRELRQLAERPNVYCKLSGLATEASAQRWASQVPQYLDEVLEAFSPERIMFGSDWPVCTLAAKYAEWCAVVERWAGRLTEAERSRLWSGTARDVYGLTVPAS